MKPGLMEDGMERIAEERALARWLHAAQEGRQRQAACLLEAGFASRNSDAQLRTMADMMLCMTQARSVQIRRQRDGTARLDVTLTLREGIRLAEAAAKGTADCLSAREQQALAAAQRIVREAGAGSETERLRRLFLWTAEHVTYENLAPGQKGYAELTCASGALLTGRANCQGFADAYRLLCALGGLRAGYLCGWSGKGIHLLNFVEADGRRYAADASRASRLLRQGSAPWAAFMLNAAGCAVLGLRWCEWMNTEEWT